ncbi:MAG: PKD domain-containing protein [Bacteroidales bacterium]|nr:PKD domain-containing protein [Bacteroidales bacterium]
MKLFFCFLVLVTGLNLFSQFETSISIHQEQFEYYEQVGINAEEWYKINNPAVKEQSKSAKDCNLNKVVYGWHPYWSNGLEANYDWSGLSHLCYFSYAVDANTGNATSSNSYLSASVIDDALANGVKVHLCVTLFSNHSTLFNNNTAKQNLISNLISYLNARGATGVNIDFEGVSSSQKDSLTSFMIQLANQLHTAISGSELTIALPSVNWSGTFDVAAMNPYVDYFVIMGYDYYYSGSTTAGPTGGLYPLTSSWTYCQSRSVNYYLNAGVSHNKLVLGVPYYGREFDTSSPTPPSSVSGSSATKTYVTVMNNASGNYSQSSKLWENNSYTPYWSYNDGNWNQCFVDDDFSLGRRYDLVNQRAIAGIGIWALGYDNGYSQLWDKIKEKFSDCGTVSCTDSIFDMGGPAWNHLDEEDYTYTIAPTGASGLSLNFESFDLEAGYDSLWLYDGNSVSSPLIGGYSGTSGPGLVTASGNSITLKFHSDIATTMSGFKAVWNCTSDNTPPTTEISAQEWASDDFLASFNDYDNEQLDLLFYQPLENDGIEWRANSNNGFLNDNFETAINSDWQQTSGTWQISSAHLNQNDQANSNTNIYAPVWQSGENVWLYHWQMNIAGTGTNRRAGIYIFSDDASMEQRNNAYMIYFRVDDNKCQIYRATENVIEIKTNDVCNVNENTWYDYKVIYNPETGEIKAYQNNILVSSWIDPNPITQGEYISLRTGDCNVNYDDIKVYKSRASTALITVGSEIENDIRFQNNSETAASCRLKSVVIDEAGNWSAISGLDVNIDWSEPSLVNPVNDGLTTDIDTTNLTTEISANWQTSNDEHSGILQYWYAVGDSPGLTNTVDWTSNGVDNFVSHGGLSLSYGSTYYVTVKAENNAGLFCDTSISDGIYIKAPEALPVANFSSSSTIFCTGQGVNFVNNSENASSYLWLFEGGVPSSSTLANPTVYYTVTGEYDVQLIVYNSFGSDTLSLTNYLEILQSPTANFYVNTTEGTAPLMVLFTNTSQYADSYLWDFGDGNTSTDSNPYNYYYNVGTYSVTLIASNENCPSNLLFLNEYITVTDSSVSVSNVCADEILIFPNPMNNFINVQYGKSFVLEIYDELGRKILQTTENQVDVSDLTKGFYIVVLKDESSGVLKVERFTKI